MNDDYDSFKQSVLDAVAETHRRFEQLSAQLNQEILEYKKTVNNAIGLLSKELLDFTTKDVAERQKRQKRQDVKDIAIGCFLCLTLAVGCSMIGALIYIIIEAGYVIR